MEISFSAQFKGVKYDISAPGQYGLQFLVNKEYVDKN